jgi:hypothetical protein
MSKSPDFVILLGARALTSLVGILGIAIGNWRTDRHWDEEGSRQTSNTNSDYRGMDAEEGNDDTPPGSAAPETTQAAKFPTSARISASAQLQSAYPQSYTAIVGWFLLALSHVFPRNDWYGLDTGLFVYLGIILVVMVGVVQTVVVRIAKLNREMRSQRIFFVITLGLGFILEGAITDIIHPDAPFWMAPLGGTYRNLA